MASPLEIETSFSWLSQQRDAAPQPPDSPAQPEAPSAAVLSTATTKQTMTCKREDLNDRNIFSSDRDGSDVEYDDDDDDEGSYDIGRDDEEEDECDRKRRGVGNKRACRKGNEQTELRILAKQETRSVRIWRWNVLLAIFATAALVTTLTYIFLHREDEDDFHTAFLQFALTIQDSTEFNLQGVVEATSGVSEVLTAEAIKTNSTWPFMTLSSFDVFVKHTRGQSSSELMVVCPFVNADQIDAWNTYSSEHQGWIYESFYNMGGNRPDVNPIPTSVYRFGNYTGRTIVQAENATTLGDYPASPFWQMSPPPFNTTIVNYNPMSLTQYQRSYNAMMETKRLVLGLAQKIELLDYAISQGDHDGLHSSNWYNASDNNGAPGNDKVLHEPGYADDHPHTALIYPVFTELVNSTQSPIVAMVMSVLPWDNYLMNLLPKGANGVVCVLRNSCGQVFTYLLRGNDATFMGNVDLHDDKYDSYKFTIEINHILWQKDYAPEPNLAYLFDRQDSGVGKSEDGNCEYWVFVYPSDELQTHYDSAIPMIFSVVVASSFLLMAMTFLVYDWYVIRKNNKIMDAAAKSNAIVSSLFPSVVRRRLYEENTLKEQRKGSSALLTPGRNRLRIYLSGGTNDDEVITSRPIADLFTDTSILFADLVGFTAWSSVREPTQVFILLETLYQAFDRIARRRRVYKVETIGDCYVAVTGLPDPMKEHATCMIRFANECLVSMRRLTHKLEARLGPDTGDLNMRFGIHSGPVTAGVLRGERSRFQLFGDTMNTASRIETNGLPGRIHVSQETADLLIAAGKNHWVTAREDLVVAKGKGQLQTYWVTTELGGAGTFDSITQRSSGSSAGSAPVEKAASGRKSSNSIQRVSSKSADLEKSSAFFLGSALSEKTERLVKWNVDNIFKLLKKIASQREVVDTSQVKSLMYSKDESKTVLDEVEEVVSLPEYDRSNVIRKYRSDALGPDVKAELTEYVATIASMYRDNAFHSFEHASHVAMSVIKLLSRIVTPDLTIAGQQDRDLCLHHYTFGITSDPLTQFACVFAALIHDVDHPGIPNSRLMVENPNMAAYYKGKSIAEQNSVDLAWTLLFSEDRFSLLRRAIFQTETELKRFRQLVVNAVMASDIMDKDLKALRNQRWTKAFEATSECSKVISDRKATIVIEHLIQASDVVHTMQHWEIFCKWNQRLFEERYVAFLDGHDSVNPSQAWYEGEKGFFDFYVIPLAKKLKECGVFGVSSDEYLTYALSNRKEWEDHGQEVVASMVEFVQSKRNKSQESSARRLPEAESDYTHSSD